METAKVIFELGHWSPRYMLGLSARLIEFYCFKCRKDIHGMTAYEHFNICCPEFIDKLNRGRKVSLGHIKQARSDYLRTFGPCKIPQQDILFPESRNDPETIKEILSSDDFKEALEPDSKDFRSRGYHREGAEAQEGD